MSQSTQLEGGAYEVIRARLDAQATDLRGRLDALNSDRQDVFGAIETALQTTERIGTEHNCIPRDIFHIGNGLLLFGYNIQFGLKQTTDVPDVFSVWRYDDAAQIFHPVSWEPILGIEAFLEDFRSLYRFYRNTFFAKFMPVGPNLHMKMRIGASEDEFKTFKWLVRGDGTLEYLGNRFDHECRYPPAQEFEWKRAHRDMHRKGTHPHVSIEDKLFVETVGGDLTIKIEDNTESGQGIYTEPVADPDQTLDDAEIFYAIVGPLVLLRVLPYREDLHRFLVFNSKTRSVHRLDAIGQSCVFLPEDQGLIFANGYLLSTGEVKTFEIGHGALRFERRILAANGEDTLYIFYQRRTGHYVLFSYNMIAQTVATPMVCNGYALMDDGHLVAAQVPDQPQKHHALQVWRTPYAKDATQGIHAAKRDSLLFKIGNADLVRAMAECRELLILLGKDDNYGDLYIDLVRRTRDILDSYFWLAKPEARELSQPLTEIHRAASAAIDEFDKVQRLRQATADHTRVVREATEKALSAARSTSPDKLPDFVAQLTNLRQRRGEIIGLRDLRYHDADLIAQLDTEVEAASAKVSQQTVTFMLRPEALDPYRSAVDAQRAQLASLAKTIEADKISQGLDQAAGDLEMLIDVVGNLKIDDPTRTTAIIESISAVYATLNGVRAELKNKRRELAKAEGSAQFGAQIKLVSQAVVNYLDLCDVPAKCDEFLGKILIQVEELEGRFSEFDDYIDDLNRKREEIQEAFESRKLALLEQRGRRAANLYKSADRILAGTTHRVATLNDIDAISGYFATDLMVGKLRDLIAELRDLGDSVKADALQTRLKSAQDDAVRQLKDRKELFAGGRDVIQFGRHRFSVNTQPLEISIIPRDGVMGFHLSGTAYFEPITDPEFLATKAVWEQEIVSENRQVYRAEWAVHQMLEENVPATTLAEVQAWLAPRHAEGYTKGVHDEDVFLLHQAMATVHADLGLLRHGPRVRAVALLFWECFRAGPDGQAMQPMLAAHLGMKKSFGTTGSQPHLLVLQLEQAIRTFLTNSTAVAQFAPMNDAREHSELSHAAAHYLYSQFLQNPDHFAVSSEAAEITRSFKQSLVAKQAAKTLDAALAPLASDPERRFLVLLDWMLGHIDTPETPTEGHGNRTSARDWTAEAAAHWLRGGFDTRAVSLVTTAIQTTGLRGQHAVIGEGGRYSGDYHAIRDRLRHFARTAVPEFYTCIKRKQLLVERKREDLRLDEFKAKVMSAFVRNKLINDVYLPLIGDNLAKQIGVAGANTRTDRMGMLLLVSPPGYGKTTIMEYVANRLGLTFMKINGPALGHQVVSLDPAEAPNLSAREEVEKLNLALEMGDNVMIYVDDIQHTHTEFLQRFISLCDAQRRIEGVFQGKARTYDLRGKKVAVVMAGNPYTEGGSRFKIPDMLANRADTYNLGDIIGGHLEVFKSSYIENALTSNPVLAKLASRHQEDVHAILRIATTGSPEGVDFQGNYAPAEIDEMVAVTRHLFAVRDTILRVNLEYIRSAAQEDAYRTEPPFKLQGSYRNMNRIAEKVLPLMTSREIRALIDDHYKNESQTLTQGAESNLLKFKEIEGIMTESEAHRWMDIKKEFSKRRLLGGAGDTDPVARVVAQLSQFSDGLDAIKDGISHAASTCAQAQSLDSTTIAKLESIIHGLRAVPVQVDIKVVPVQYDGSPAEPDARVPVAIEQEVTQGSPATTETPE